MYTIGYTYLLSICQTTLIRRNFGLRVAMAPKLDRKLKHDAVIMDASGMKQKDIVTTLDVSRSTITRAKRKLKETGDIEGGGKKRGPKGKLDEGMRNVFFLFSIIDGL